MKFNGDNMEENKDLMVKEEKEQLIKNKDRLKVIKIASIILFAIDLISLVFSLLTKKEFLIEAKEIGYIIVLAVCIIIFIISIIFIKKTQKKMLELEGK